MTEDTRAQPPSDIRDQVRESIRMLLDIDKDTPGTLSQGAPEIHPYDIASVLQDFTAREARAIVAVLPPAKAAETILRADPRTRHTLLASFDETRMAQIVSALQNDDAVDVLQSLPLAAQESALVRIPKERASVLRQLTAYDAGTAAGMMTAPVAAARESETAGDIIARLKSSEETIRSACVYVVDDGGRPKGIIPAMKLAAAPPDAPASGIMTPEAPFARIDDDWTKVAFLVRKYRLTEVPVVDADGRLAGVVTADDVADAADARRGEDILRMGGTSGVNPTRESAGRQVVARLPWLLITLSSAIVAALIISRHAPELKIFTPIVFFLPAVAAVGANAAIASSAVVVRGMSAGEVDGSRLMRILTRELTIGSVLAVLIGLAAGFFVSFYMSGDVHASDFGLSVGLSTVIGVLSSVCIGTLLPLLWSRLGHNPAAVAGPFVIALADVTCMAIYLSVATQMMVESPG